MTCIVGLVDLGNVYMGADSAGVDDRWSLSIRRDSKIVRRQAPAQWGHAATSMLIGFTTSFRMGQLLAYRLCLPDMRDCDLFEWMVTDFVDAVRACLKDGGWASKTNDREAGGVFLVGISGRLFRIDDDFQVGEAACDYNACGCGADIAIGSLWSTPDLGPEQRIDRALRAAAAHNAGVCGPFRVLVAEAARA